LIGCTTLCAHWFKFTGQQFYFNHRYPVSVLGELISTCFGLGFGDLPTEAILAGLSSRCIVKKRLKSTRTRGSVEWVARIRGQAYHPQDPWGRLVPLTVLGQRGVLPPIKIRFFLGESR
jgi:hypothetical protein